MTNPDELQERLLDAAIAHVPFDAWGETALLAGANRMSLPHFLLMNALGAICWALLLRGGAYRLGVQMKRVAGPVGLLLLILAVGLVAGGIIFFRHHEKELEERAEKTIPGPLLDAP